MTTKSIVYIDMDDVLCDFTPAFIAAKSNNPAIAFPQSQYGFFKGLAPIEGALEAFQQLLSSPQHDPYILTAPSLRNPLSYTEKRVWVENHLGYEVARRLIICANKGLLKGEYLIDDNKAGKGQEDFTGKLLQFGSEDFPNWQSIKQYLFNSV